MKLYQLKNKIGHLLVFFGKFDKSELQRGFQVFKEVCSTCHSLKRIRFHDLSRIGFDDDEIKALAASYEIHDGPNQEGEMFDRKGLPSDAYPLGL
jgi:ubiquinol-cytochrome c reductase cytochrome c1 subunit